MFTPEELESRSFVFVRRGFDPDEVGAFLRAVADDMRRLQSQVADAKTEVKAHTQPVDGAMADAMAIMQAARESAARIEAQAEQRALERMSRAETDAESRLERARNDADTREREARERAEAILSEASATHAAIEAETVALRAAAEADAAAIKQAARREVAELELLARRRRRIIEDAHETLDQWLGELRMIVSEARAADADEAATVIVPQQDGAAYPQEPLPAQHEEHTGEPEIAAQPESYDAI